MNLLVPNLGSTSLKYQILEMPSEKVLGRGLFGEFRRMPIDDDDDLGSGRREQRIEGGLPDSPIQLRRYQLSSIRAHREVADRVTRYGNGLHEGDRDDDPCMIGAKSNEARNQGSPGVHLIRAVPLVYRDDH